MLLRPPVNRRRILVALGWLAATLVGAIALSLAFGSEALDLSAALHGVAPDAQILHSRIPRVVLACIVGAALGVSGAALQAVVENPLADPFVLGLSGGAAVGATTAIAIGSGAFGLAGGTFASGSLVGICSLVGALGSAARVFSLGRQHGRLVPERMLLVGVVFNAFASALILAVESLAAPNLLESVMRWLVGSLGYPSTTELATAAVAVTLGSALLVRTAPALNLLALGELDAHALGVNVAGTRSLIFLTSAVLVAAAVSLSGVVAFVGLIVPHLIRLAFGADHRWSCRRACWAGPRFSRWRISDRACSSAWRIRSLPSGW